MRASGSGWELLGLVARALEGEAGALGELAASSSLAQRAIELGVAPALALRARGSGVEAPAPWRRALTGGMSTWLLVDEALRHAGGALDAAGIAWAPIKGYDVATRFYDEREMRPTSDLDLLVAEADFDAARGALAAAGWGSLGGGELEARYLREEGYAWQATGPYPVALEVHFRLWGMVPAGWPEAMLERSRGDRALGREARRLLGHDGYLLAAVHAWTKERPRGLLDWWDLVRIARGGGATGGPTAAAEPPLAEAVAAAAGEWDLELPVALSAAVAERLWPATGAAATQREIARALADRLRPVEARLLERLHSGGPDAVSYGDVVLARLRAGRRSRMGWRSVWRRLWPHPGTVARETPAAWSWPRRRFKSLLAALRGARPA